VIERAPVIEPVEIPLVEIHWSRAPRWSSLSRSLTPRCTIV